MCILIRNETGAPIPLARLDDIARDNPDGVGIYWMDNQQVEYHSSSARLALERLAQPRTGFVAHFRYRTRGSMADKNLHPHRIGATGCLLFHNGTVRGLGSVTGWSDTRHMASLLSRVNRDVWPELLAMAAPSRFVVVDTVVGTLDDYGPLEKGAADGWLCIDEVWYSKDPTSWKPYYKSGTDKSSTVFVYGTLKQGYGNHRLLADADFIGDAWTDEPHALDVGGPYPYLYETDGDGDGDGVRGELYRVDAATLARLDALEGVPHHYVRLPVDVTTDDGESYVSETYYDAQPSPAPDAVLAQEWNDDGRIGEYWPRYATEDDTGDYSTGDWPSGRLAANVGHW